MSALPFDDNFPAAALTIGQLKQLVMEAASQAQVDASRKVASGVERISAGRAATIAKKRRSVVLAACKSGALLAHRDGSRWSIKVSDLDKWCADGFPVSRR